MIKANNLTVEQIRIKTLETLRKMLPAGQSSNALSTEQLAKILNVKEQTIRRGICVNSHYLGLIPEKLPNGRLYFIISD